MTEFAIKEMLTEKGISPSYHRIRIIKYIAESKSHPTLEELYQALAKDIPTLSKSTIYNNLHILTEKGILRKVVLPGEEPRYDFVDKPHIHFKCRYCGKIYDVYFDWEKYLSIIKEDLLKEGHHLMDFEINAVGVCKDCAKKMN